MVFRLSLKLAKKIGVAPTSVVPLDSNPLADWSGHLFSADRTQYVILTNTASLYSAVWYGRGVTDAAQFIERGLGAIREVMDGDGLEIIHRRMVAPSTGTIAFTKALNRSVTGSMNDLINCAKVWLIEEELSPHDVSVKLNEMPMSAIGYTDPRRSLKSLLSDQEVTDDSVLSWPFAPFRRHSMTL